MGECKSKSGREKRQSYGKNRAFSFNALELDFATVQIHAALNNQQSQASSRDLSHVTATMERLEQSLLVRRRNATPSIRDAATGFITIALDDEAHLLIRR